MTARARTIHLPTDNPARLAQLTLKLAEYRGRITPYRAPETQMESICKITVLERLLRDGRVAPALACELGTRFGSGFNPDAFRNACAVIADYCTTGGTKNCGGTGLPAVQGAS